MKLNGAARAPFFGAGHDDVDLTPCACPRCGAQVWTGAVEREHPLYENDDGSAHAMTCGARVKVATLVIKPKKGSTPP